MIKTYIQGVKGIMKYGGNVCFLWKDRKKYDYRILEKIKKINTDRERSYKKLMPPLSKSTSVT